MYLHADKSCVGLCRYPGIVCLGINYAVAEVLHPSVFQHSYQGHFPHYPQPAQAAQEQEHIGQQTQSWKLIIINIQK